MQNAQDCYGIPNRDNAPYSYLEMYNGSNAGAASYTVFYFQNTTQLVGPNIRIKLSTQNDGTYVQVMKDGIYSISATVNSATNTAAACAITVNSTAYTTAGNDILPPVCKAMSTVPAVAGTNISTHASWTGRLKAGDVITIQGTANTPAAPTRCRLGVSQVSAS